MRSAISKQRYFSRSDVKCSFSFCAMNFKGFLQLEIFQNSKICRFFLARKNVETFFQSADWQVQQSVRGAVLWYSTPHTTGENRVILAFPLVC